VFYHFGLNFHMAQFSGGRSDLLNMFVPQAVAQEERGSRQADRDGAPS
jgi:hypothetical protein